LTFAPEGVVCLRHIKSVALVRTETERLAKYQTFPMQAKYIEARSLQCRALDFIKQGVMHENGQSTQGRRYR
jgi:hypothetical protein